MTTKHTPTPWNARVEAGFDLVTAQRNHVCGGLNEESVFALNRDPAERKANAAFIVEACNAHDRLIAERDSLHDKVTGLSELNAILRAERDALQSVAVKLKEANRFLQTERDELAAALRLIADHPREEPIPQLIVRFQRIARAALAKINGGKS